MDYLNNLESTISACQSLGLVIIMGDFNAHLGTLGCFRNNDSINGPGRVLFDMICRCNLFVASEAVWASGPSHTFANKNHQTTVDYCIVGSTLADSIDFCGILHQQPLNVSDHLPVAISFRSQIPPLLNLW